MEKDNIFAEKQARIKPFAFNREVARVFDDMLVRSVPLYRESILRQAQLAARYYRPGSRIYDLGCSHGNLGVLILDQLNPAAVSLVGVDSSRPMLDKYRSRLGQIRQAAAVDLVCGNMEDIRITDASVVIINLTLQFLARAKREGLIQTIYNGLLPGGILLLTEKTVHASGPLNDLHLSFYEQFKRENGYSDLEISQKRDALEKVLVPDTLEIHENRLYRAGFSRVEVWLKWFNFAAMIAVKESA